MKDIIRTGEVSSIDFENGMIKVTYPDRDNDVTDSIPYLSLNGEYKMPNIGDMVVVLHLSNGSSFGIALGTFWSYGNKPFKTGKGLYRKELSNTQNEAYLEYDSSTKTLIIKADNVVFQSNKGTTSL
ncbi:hypothetical protein SAMN02746066_03414 [Anaerosporobacter mobilis DSM 15930]|jgi:phage baseplate assembly protein gpV|uniref:Phage baseplate assembly protein V n=1 Tax=Anaerosporobacter mobilis DSM 15930 TaxID=1120996 RepID=A0A1M7LVS7_9FIRM|nr:hypothetical protein [Anaerosporobacter mobilis]SHM81894.1 hypothetical protein SAMN02746066_03414 [Anaerosporobacter mobilis DSM 15930]